MTSPPDRPNEAGGPRPKGWSDDLGVIASDASVRLGRVGRRLVTLNNAAAGWITTISWRRFILLGFIALIGVNVIGDVSGLGRPTVRLDSAALRKPVDIAIHSDGKSVHIQPSVGGKPTRAIDIPIPDASKTPATGSKALPGFKGHRGIVFDSNGKRIVIDRNGVRVLEGEAARLDAEADAIAKQAGREGRVTADAPDAADATADSPGARKADGASDLDVQQAADAARALDGRKLSSADAERVRRTIADDMSLQVKAAVEDAKDEVQRAISDEIRAATRTAPPSFGSVVWSLIKLMIVVSFIYLIILKATSNAKRRAAVAVQSASEVAERESLKRQVSEAKMQMMQAQVEPHFLFNTLASIDHLIETDPPRASTMQKNLIQYLRAALPQMRENATDLGREVDLVSAYLEILKVRMEERLQVTLHIPNGLRSADFPPMMLQSMVENAIKHGLEPKAEGGRLDVEAEIVHGDLRVTVTDTGLGFAPGGASTAGTGLGLSNIRERLKLLYGDNAMLTIEANLVDGAPLGTRVTIAVPYQSRRSGGPARG